MTLTESDMAQLRSPTLRIPVQFFMNVTSEFSASANVLSLGRFPIVVFRICALYLLSSPTFTPQ